MLVALATACLIMLHPPVAHAATAAKRLALTAYDGGDLAFSGSLDGLVQARVDEKFALMLSRMVTWTLPLPGVDARSVVRLLNGNTLVADANGGVTEYRPDKTVAWAYGRSNDPSLMGVVSAQRLINGNTLVCDQTGRRVIEIGPDRLVKWSYSATDNPGLAGPTSARRLSDGHTLVTDANSGKVLDVAPDGSMTALWDSGKSGSPVDASRLADGSTLIVDKARHSVFALSGAGVEVWRFGVSGAAGSDARHLNSPTSAQQLSDGTIVIADAGNDRIVKLSAKKKGPAVQETLGVLDVIPCGSFGSGNQLYTTPTGTQLVINDSTSQLLEIGYGTTGTYTSKATPLIDADPEALKWVTRLIPSASLPLGPRCALGIGSTAAAGRARAPAPHTTLPSLRGRRASEPSSSASP